MKKLLLALVLVGLCSFAEASVLGIFENTDFPTGISGECNAVHRLEIIDNELYAATENGIYRYSESDNSWSLWALEDVNVLDFKVCGDDVVAMIVPEGQKGSRRGEEVARLVRFNIFRQEMTDITYPGMIQELAGKQFTYMMRMAQHPQSLSTIMVAAYPGIWISEDFGSSWHNSFDWVFGYNNHQFLGWHPDAPDVMFYTSESEIYAAQILRSGNGGQDWNVISPDRSGDNACHHLAFDPKDANHILYSGEGCIFESNDCGNEWHCVYREDPFNRETIIGYAYNVMFDHADDNMVYAVGCDSIEECIHIFRSSDNGKTWCRIARSDSPSAHGYWIHESIFFNGRIYVYTGNGVLAYTPGGTSGVTDISNGLSREDEPSYDIYGRKTDNPQPGTICIRSGRKIIIQQ